MALKVINTAKQAGGNRPLKVQTIEEQNAARRVLNNIGFEYATCVFEIDGEIWACKMSMSRLLEGLAISGKNAKILCPFGKNQLLDMIEEADALELIGESIDLDNIMSNPRYHVSNRGQACEYLLAKKYHAKFDHAGAMVGSNGEFRGTEVKFFGFDHNGKIKGTPSATIALY